MFLRRIFHLVVLAVVTWAVGTPMAWSETIKLTGDVWAPYVMDPASGSKGFMVDIAELVFTRAGYTVDFTVTPWSRALVSTDSGDVDGIVGIYFDQAKEKNYVIPAEEIGVSVNNLFVVQSSTWKYTGIPSLETKVLATIADYDYGDLNPYIEKLAKAKSKYLDVMTGNEAIQQNLKKLLAARVDVVVEDPVVVNFTAALMKITGQIKSVGKVSPANRCGIAFSAKNPKAVDLAKILSEGIVKLRKTGELKAILAKYSAQDWKG